MSMARIAATFIVYCSLAGINAQSAATQEKPGKCTCPPGNLANLSVCGTDGFDYINICVLQEAQKTDPSLGRRCIGRCPCQVKEDKATDSTCYKRSGSATYIAADFGGNKTPEEIVNMIGVEHAAYGEEHLQRCLFSQMQGGSGGRPGWNRPRRTTTRPTTAPALPQLPVAPVNGGGQTGGGTGGGAGGTGTGGGTGGGQTGGQSQGGGGSGSSTGGQAGGSETGGAGQGQSGSGGTSGADAGEGQGEAGQSGSAGAGGGQNSASGSVASGGTSSSGSSSSSSSSSFSSSSSSGGSTINSESSGNSNPAPVAGNVAQNPLLHPGQRPGKNHGKKPVKGRRTVEAPPPDVGVCMTNGQTMPNMMQANCALESSSDKSLGVRCLGKCETCKDLPPCPTS